MATTNTLNHDAATEASTESDVPSDTTTIIDPIGGNHTHTVIFLHGREDYGSYLSKDFFDSKSSDGRTLAEIFPTIRWVFPTAKLQVSARRKHELNISSWPSVAGEEIISQWFDIWNVQDPEERKELAVPGLQESIRDIIGIIREEEERVPLERVILGGLSQGCATAMLTLLFAELDLGGFVGWCGWLPFQRDIEDLPRDRCFGNKHEISCRISKLLQTSTAVNGTSTSQAITDTTEADPEDVLKTPIFLGHALDDHIVPVKLGDDMHQIMKRLGFDVTWKKYDDGGHWIHPKQGVDNMSTFIQSIIDS